MVHTLLKNKNGMTMAGGVTLSNGKVIESSQELSSLSIDEITELANTNVSMLQYFTLKKERHEFINEVQKVYHALEDIKESLKVTVVNGEKRDVSLAQLVLEIYERERPRRRWLAFKDFMSHYKKIFVIATIIMVVSLFFFRHHIVTVIEWLTKVVLTFIKTI